MIDLIGTIAIGLVAAGVFGYLFQDAVSILIGDEENEEISCNAADEHELDGQLGA